jgi:predicted GIY-YIG superfamily endonuclease
LPPGTFSTPRRLVLRPRRSLRHVPMQGKARQIRISCKADGSTDSKRDRWATHDKGWGRYASWISLYLGHVWRDLDTKRSEAKRDETRRNWPRKKKLSLLTSWAGQGTVGQQWSENISQVNQFNAGF